MENDLHIIWTCQFSISVSPDQTEPRMYSSMSSWRSNMATRKTVAEMDEAEREYKRWNDRVNQQYSRARKRRRFEDLQAQNKKLTAELEAVKTELESFRRREAAVRSALEWVSTVVNDSPASTNNKTFSPSVDLEKDIAPLVPQGHHEPLSTVSETTESQKCFASTSTTTRLPQRRSPTVKGHEVSAVQLGTLSPTANISASGNPITQAVPESAVHETAGLATNGQTQEYEIPISPEDAFANFTSTFSGLDGNCVMNLPDHFGDGAYVDLLSADLWQTSPEYFNPTFVPMTPGESPPANSQPIAQPVQTRQDGFYGNTTPLQHATQSPVWQQLPLNMEATNELDVVLLEVTALGRQWKAKQGDFHSELSHPSFPSVSSLLNRNVENDRSNNPLAAALGKYTVTTTVVNFARKVAFHYTVAHLLRWLVNPTEQSFNHLPDFLKPTHIQKTIPHPAWIDTVPWPQARDRIITNLRIFDFELFKRVTRYSSINWPYSDRELFIAKQGSKQMMLNPNFVRHIQNLNNWTNGPDLAKAFSFLKGWPTSPPIGEYQWPD